MPAVPSNHNIRCVDRVRAIQFPSRARDF